MNVLARIIWFLIVWIIFIVALFYIGTPEIISIWFDLELWFGQIHAIGVSAVLSAIMIFGIEENEDNEHF